jgi:UDP-2,3-diacylglucosamine pyrophosphatase LpxH
VRVDTIIVSDLHLGSGVSRPDALRRMLRQQTFKRLILNGDIFDDMNIHRLRRRDWKLLSYIRKLARPPLAVEVVWVAGNHDLLLRPLADLIGARVCREFSWLHCGRRFLAIHGHQFDTFIRERAFITSVATFLYACAQRIDTQNYRWSRFLKRRTKMWLRNSERVAHRAMEYAQRKQADVILCGHTHHPSRIEADGVLYLNSGCWTDNYSYIAIPADSSHALLFEEVQLGAPEPEVAYALQ